MVESTKPTTSSIVTDWDEPITDFADLKLKSNLSKGISGNSVVVHK